MVKRLFSGIVAENYQISRKLTSGSYGDIYAAFDIHNGEAVAIKFESSRRFCVLENEYEIYKSLGTDVIGLPEVKYFGTEQQDRVMVMQLLGPSLAKLFLLCSQKFSLKTVLLIAVQLINRIEYIHSQHIIHCDLKPDNILIGLGESENTIHLIDFGLSGYYRNPYTHRHTELMENQGPIGTTRFSSVNAQSGRTLSRRDDLESLAYILIHFLHGGLPWQGIDTRPKKNKEIILKMKQVSASTLCQGLPVEFAEFLKHARELQFKQRPNYDHFRDLFLHRLATVSSGPFLFDWELITASMPVA